MSILLVDIGNSRLKWATLANGVLGSRHATAHASQWTPARIASMFRGMTRPGRVLVACVAGVDAESAVATHALDRWGCAAEFVRATACAAGVTNGYERPEQLGVDRWLALIAAHADHAGAACIADCGTAVTVDTVDAAGRHLGGMILPGVAAMSECVLARTHIPVGDIETTDTVFGRRTAEALAGGGLNAVAGAIERSLAAARDALGTMPRLLLAGGDSDRVAAALGVSSQMRRDLVIEGLAVLAMDANS